MKKTILVEVSRFARFVKVSKSKIVIPSNVRAKYVEYRSESSPFIVFLSILVVAISIGSLPLLGFLAVSFLVVSMIFIAYVDKRRRQKEVAVLKSLMPEEKVLDIVKRVAKVCEATNRGTETVVIDDLKLRVRCGTPYKCVKYDKEALKKLTSIYIPVATMLVISYALLPPAITLVIALIALLVILYTNRMPLCDEFLVKKEEIKLEI